MAIVWATVLLMQLLTRFGLILGFLNWLSATVVRVGTCNKIIVRSSALINIQYQYGAVLILILNIVRGRHGVLIESRLLPPTPRGSSRASK